jgi:N-acetylglutamate synthase-like GNAT family acetyltransferase
MTVRVAQMQDAQAITRVINAAFRRAESFFIDRDRIEPETVRDLLRKGVFLVAEEAGVLTGCVYVEPRGDRSYLGLLSVNPESQKSGLGSTLMIAAEDYCAKTGARHIDLQIVNLRKELPAFYRSRGYVETGTAPFIPGIDTKLPCHFIKMSKPLP